LNTNEFTAIRQRRQEIRQDFQQLGQDLQAGDVAAAQKAYSSLAALFSPSDDSGASAAPSPALSVLA
jgi:hypothetical protein